MEHKVPLLEKKSFNVRIRHWWKFFIVVQLILVCLMAGTLGTRYWVRQGSHEYKWEGGLLKCFHCIDEWDDEYYQDIAEIACDKDGDIWDSWCDQFEGLRDGGRVYLALELVVMVILLLWIGRLGADLFSYDYFFRSEIFFFVFVGVGILFKVVALVVWTVLTMAFFYGDCYSLSDGSDRANMCATTGPSLAVLTTIVYSVMSGLFMVVWFGARDSLNAHQPLESQRTGDQ